MNPYYLFCRTLTISMVAAGMTTAVMAQTSSASAKPSGADTKSSAPPDGKPAEEALTAAQLAKIKTILAPYKAASLTANDAKAIKRALRDAELRPSRALGDALLAAGFDPRRLEELDPRPPGPPPPRPAGSTPGVAPK
jgi:Spy/CpxP family protein refolding chaperone